MAYVIISKYFLMVMQEMTVKRIVKQRRKNFFFFFFYLEINEEYEFQSSFNILNMEIL